MVRKMTKAEQLEHMIKVFSNISAEDLQITQDALKHVLEKKAAQTALRRQADNTKFMIVDPEKMKIMQ